MKIHVAASTLLSLFLLSCAHTGSKKTSGERSLAAANPMWGPIDGKRYDLEGKPTEFGRDEDTWQALVAFNQDLSLVSDNVTGPDQWGNYGFDGELIIANGELSPITGVLPKG